MSLRTRTPANRGSIRPLGPTPELILERSRARLSLLMHEYDSVRTEHLACRSAQQTIMMAAVASAAAVFAGLLSTWANVNLRIGILSFAPLFLALIWAMWFGEVVRIARTSWFLWELERVINTELKENVQPPTVNTLDPTHALHYEGWLRGTNPWGRPLRARASYILASLILLGTGFIATVLSLVYALTLSTVPNGLVFVACTAALAWIGMVGYAITSLRNPLITSASRMTP